MSEYGEYMIEVDNISKSYGEIPAVKNLSFSVAAGSVFAFLGTNGAGKSTTISCITTVLRADSGSIRIDGLAVGQNDDAIRSTIGVVFQSSLLDPTLTVRENLSDRAAFYGLSRARLSERMEKLSDLVQLGEFLDRPYGLLSGGQKRRADIARALLHEPGVLFLDEPTAGLDPHSREQVWHTVHELRATQGLTVFLTTHYMEETEEADNVAIIHAGTLVVSGTPGELRRRYSSSILTVTSGAPDDVHRACARTGLTMTSDSGSARISVADSAQAFRFLEDNRAIIDDFEFRHGTMDDVFLAVTAKGVNS
ncbi:hypothetical protein VT73_06580 [Rathayibacter toxicus]|uniref:ABC transporter domain-containing protein n=2 Tax=Rathayibacter toxicus TaxID=145458 RepID=A0A0C5BF98_9MICO|nr:hypothetical protein TI83_06890 [Rathayibacter toxicus]KKM45299.1 hypothetical protein VT73_06580 [Rathayibacter toxicus]